MRGDGAEVGVGAFLVAGGDRAEVLQPVDGAFDGVAFLVALAVDAGGPTTSGASIAPVSLLVESFRDGVLDSASSQVAAVSPGRVGLIGMWVGRWSVQGRGWTGHLCCKQHRECFDKSDVFWPLPYPARPPYRSVIRAILRATSRSAGTVEFFTRVRSLSRAGATDG